MTTTTTDDLPAFPQAINPTTLAGALHYLEKTRLLLAEECRQRAALEQKTSEALAIIASISIEHSMLWRLQQTIKKVREALS